MKDIYLIASLFRQGIIQSSKKPGISFPKFPKGCCGSTCHLLLCYLQSVGELNWKYVRAEARRGYMSHAWISKDYIICDITGDQFKEFRTPVYVGFISDWHSRKWKNLRILETDYAEYTKTLKNSIYTRSVYDFYEEVKKFVDQKLQNSV